MALNFSTLSRLSIYYAFVIGIQGFEPWTFATQMRRATKLRYIPIFLLVYHRINFFINE